MAACMARPDFADLTAETSCTVKDQTYVNHNKLLTLCPGCIGGKTGYTEAAGRCLVSCCEREGTRLICVTLHDPDDWQDHQLLYHWAFGAYSTRTLGGKLDLYVPVLSGTRTLLPVETGEHRLFLPRMAELRLVVHLPRFVFAPVEEGDSAGELSLLKDGETLVRYPIIYTQGAVLADPCLNPS
jgi:D-alanyl-D-alanine carboxypeptidase